MRFTISPRLSRALLLITAAGGIAALVGCAAPFWQEEPGYGWRPEDRRFGALERREDWDGREPIQDYLERRRQEQERPSRTKPPYSYRDGDCDVSVRRRWDGTVVEERRCPSIAQGYEYGRPAYPSRPEALTPYGYAPQPYDQAPEPAPYAPHQQPYSYAPQPYRAIPQQPLPPIEEYELPDEGRRRWN